MMRILTKLLVAGVLAAVGWAQTPAATAPKKPAKPVSKKPSGNKADRPSSPSPAAKAVAPANTLDGVLAQLDRAAANFKSAAADFQWDQFQLVVQETDTQSGKVYFVRHDKDVHMAADIQQPDKKYLVFTDAKLRLYQPRIEQVEEYDTGKNRAEVESFLVLGFGSRGHDLLRSFDVNLLGEETVDGVRTAKLELIPKAQKVRSMFERIILWIDPERDVSLKQQAFEPSGDHRTAYYRNIKLNEKIDDDVFKLKTTGKTKVVQR